MCHICCPSLVYLTQAQHSITRFSFGFSYNPSSGRDGALCVCEAKWTSRKVQATHLYLYGASHQCALTVRAFASLSTIALCGSCVETFSDIFFTFNSCLLWSGMQLDRSARLSFSDWFCVNLMLLSLFVQQRSMWHVTHVDLQIPFFRKRLGYFSFSVKRVDHDDQ